MDPTDGPETDATGVGLVQGRHAPEATAELTDDVDLAWDRFVPDEEEDDEDEDFFDALEGLDVEDSESVAEDLELRWDVFQRDADDAEDDAKSARFEAVLERMAQRAQRHAEGGQVDDEAAEAVDEGEHDDAHLATAFSMLVGVTEVSPVDDVVAGDATFDGTLAGEEHDSNAYEDDHTDSAFARLEEAMYGGGERTQRASEGLDEPYDWLGEDDADADADADAELDEALRSEAESGSIHVEFEEPEAWLEDDDEIGNEVDENAEAAGAVASLAPVEDEVPATLAVEVGRDGNPEDEGHEAVGTVSAVASLAAVEDNVPGATPVEPDWHYDWEEDWTEVDTETADTQWADPSAETDVLPVAVAGAVATSGLSVDEDNGSPSSAPVAERPVTEHHDDDSETVLEEDLGAGPPEVARRSRRHRRASAEQNDVRRLALLACLFFAVVLGAVVLHFGHTESNGSTPTTPANSSPAQVARLESAIADVQSASSGAQGQLTTLTAFPTPPRVATTINPYVDSLHLYDTLATTVTVPARARDAAQAAETQVRSDITFLRTINGLPPIELGAFINGFFARSTQLQQTMDTLQHALAPADS